MSKRMALVVVAGLAALALVAVFGGAALAQGPGYPFGRGMMGGPGMMGGYGAIAPRLGVTQTTPFGPGGMMGSYGMMGRGMMGGYGMMRPRLGVTQTVPFGPGGMMGGPGIMGRGMMNGFGMMGPRYGLTQTVPFGPGGMMGRGMMGGYGMMVPGYAVTGTLPCPMMGSAAQPGNTQPITAAQARAAATAYVDTMGEVNLVVSEIMEFGNNFYVSVVNKTNGDGAFELLVDRYGGYVHPEPGPNMMWNTEYGHMAAALGQAAPMTVGVEQARAAAQKFLDANFPGAKLAPDSEGFPGYYTLDFTQNGKTAGMLGVNGYTGQVWYHSWHGPFIGETAPRTEM